MDNPPIHDTKPRDYQECSSQVQAESSGDADSWLSYIKVRLLAVDLLTSLTQEAFKIGSLNSSESPPKGIPPNLSLRSSVLFTLQGGMEVVKPPPIFPFTDNHLIDQQPEWSTSFSLGRSLKPLSPPAYLESPKGAASRLCARQ
ncbi:hypothetical protein AVEN_140913-1 [Araneus ventricosus]|uniref:Uncharacterized protein n=1 Tax=Araneus ventricosus TaxID=182803 RepID=A0A4Y2JQ75_ARAVE|nr:hypothetical protein AVEN_140913-1 [Araneus ventricosus]